MVNEDFILSLQLSGVPVTSCKIAERNDTKYDHIIVQRADGSVGDSFFYDRLTGEVIDGNADIHPTIAAISRHISSPNSNETSAGGPTKRGRGRPRLHTPYATKPKISENSRRPDLPQSFRPYSNEPQTYYIGDFVIERGDYFSGEPFPIYVIALGNVLKKYECIVRGGVTLHESSSRFLAYKENDSLKNSFIKIEVSVMSYNGRHPSVVRVSKDCLPPRIDESLRDNLLVYFFGIYVQCLICQSLNGELLKEMKSQEYFSESLEQIDHLLFECAGHILTCMSLDEEILRSLDRLPFFRVEDLDAKSRKMRCEVNNDILATRVLILSGPTYDPDTLKNISGSSERIAYLVNDQCLDLMLTYHGVRHFKYHLFLEATTELNYRRTKRIDDAAVVEKCLSNTLWIQHSFKKLKHLADKCNIEFGISEESS